MGVTLTYYLHPYFLFKELSVTTFKIESFIAAESFAIEWFFPWNVSYNFWCSSWQLTKSNAEKINSKYFILKIFSLINFSKSSQQFYIYLQCFDKLSMTTLLETFHPELVEGLMMLHSTAKPFQICSCTFKSFLIAHTFNSSPSPSLNTL